MNRITFHQIKANGYRTVHMDGAVGGITPGGNLAMTIYNERTPLAQMTKHEMELLTGTQNQYKVGPPIESETVSKEGIIREMEFTAVMNPATAKALYDWLGQHLSEFEKIGAGKQ